jgi:hypothetical protein
MSTPPNPYDPPPSPEYPQSAYGPPNRNQTPMMLAAGSLVTGVLGLVSCGCCLFMPLPVLSIILGAIALTMKPEQNAKVMAIVGICLAGFTLLAWIAMFVFQIGLGVSQEFRPEF